MCGGNAERTRCLGTPVTVAEKCKETPTLSFLIELFTLFGHPIFSMDDMNIIQVGRSAVSRYHQTRRFFEAGLGYDQGTHDLPAVCPS